MSKYAPRLDYLCDDPECCDNGCPRVSCRFCGKEWPCPDYIASHTPAQVEAQRRYVDRKWYMGDTDMVEWKATQRALRDGGSDE